MDMMSSTGAERFRLSRRVILRNLQMVDTDEFLCAGWARFRHKIAKADALISSV